MPGKKIFFISGILTGLCFAPIYFFPGLLGFSFLAHHIHKSSHLKQSLIIGYLFGFGLFLSSLYWISFSIFVYINEFWWVFPFALLGIPLFLSIFCCLFSGVMFYLRNHSYYQLLFCTFWILTEWVLSRIFTGFPWAMIGYSFTFSEALSQSASLFGVLGLSFIAVYVGTCLYKRDERAILIFTSVIILATMMFYGNARLKKFPTEYTDIQVKIVQPSIKQESKWSPEMFWNNLDKLIALSSDSNKADLIIWPESALILSYSSPLIANKLQKFLVKSNSILITGSTEEEGVFDHDDYKLFVSMVAIDPNMRQVFLYNKTHLVPFGEYIPLKKYIPIKKLTYGTLDYTPGIRTNVFINSLNLNIYPLICYEIIFFNEITTNNKLSDVIITITNDAWYGNSSGPYQHFAISKLRAIEYGLPLIRAANNGISAVIDPVGRVIEKLELNEINTLSSQLPKKLRETTSFSCNNCVTVIIMLFMIALFQRITFLARNIWVK